MGEFTTALTNFQRLQRQAAEKEKDFVARVRASSRVSVSIRKCAVILFVCQTCLHNAAYKSSHLTPDTAELVLYDFMVKVELSCSDAPLRIVTFSLPLSHL